MHVRLRPPRPRRRRQVPRVRHRARDAAKPSLTVGLHVPTSDIPHPTSIRSPMTTPTPPPVILCPGQGAQAVGMGKAWFDASPEARSVFEAADKQLGNRLGAPLSKLCFEGPFETLNRT